MSVYMFHAVTAVTHSILIWIVTELCSL